jgi:DNA-binding NtrC family response regulator
VDDLDGGEESVAAPSSTVSLRDRDGEHLAIHRVRLIATGGADHGRLFEAEGSRVTLGTHERCDLVLREASVSRWHAELHVEHDGVRVTDLDSSNGTTVDGVRIERAYLVPGAVLGLGRARLRFEVADRPVRVPVASETRFGGLVGTSPATRAVFALLERAAQSDATVLLHGETGTGKEVAARSVHERSARSGGPFVVVDCASIPPELMESELFGHLRGSFTGAVGDRVGAFAAADKGTIFLDEIGELPIALQPKLLRALEAREVKPVGGHAYRPIDVRVVAATHRDLPREIGAGAFRSDLYYRLAVIEVRIPPLRDRLDDLPALLDALVDELDAPPDALAAVRAPEFLARVRRHRWPGNIRELRNHVERTLALGADAPSPAAPAAAADDDVAPGLVDVSIPLKIARERWNAELERRYLAALLDAHGGNVSAAARAAGIDRSHLHRLLARRRD